MADIIKLNRSARDYSKKKLKEIQLNIADQDEIITRPDETVT